MEIGIIGLGDMGKLYANKFVRAGYAVNGCDLPVKRDKLEEELNKWRTKSFNMTATNAQLTSSQYEEYKEYSNRHRN